MANVYEFEGMVPVVDPAAFVHPTAVLIGDVIVGPGCYIGAQAVLRGDFGRLVLHSGSNLQDTCVMHGFPESDTVVEADGHVGHGAILHGCHIGRDALIGMNAVVMDNAEVGEQSIVAALAFVKADVKIPPRSLFAGVPGRILRQVTEQEIAWKSTGTAVYQDLARRSLASMRPVAPLIAPEPNRRRFGRISGFDPLFAVKRSSQDTGPA